MKKSSAELTKDKMADVRVVKDFQSQTLQSVLSDYNMKVTLSLSQRSIDFFKREGKMRSVPYQKMILAMVMRNGCGSKKK